MLSMLQQKEFWPVLMLNVYGKAMLMQNYLKLLQEV